MTFHQDQAPSNRSEINCDSRASLPQDTSRNLADWRVLEENCRMIVSKSLECDCPAKTHLYMISMPCRTMRRFFWAKKVHSRLVGRRRVTKGIYTPSGAPADQGWHPAYTTASAQGTRTTGAIHNLHGNITFASSSFKSCLRVSDTRMQTEIPV